jgi:hypothetical protein
LQARLEKVKKEESSWLADLQAQAELLDHEESDDEPNLTME